MAQQQNRRPIAHRDARVSPAPEKAVEGARTREPIAEEAAVDDERATRHPARVRQISGGEVHWFSGGGYARETR